MTLLKVLVLFALSLLAFALLTFVDLLIRFFSQAWVYLALASLICLAVHRWHTARLRRQKRICRALALIAGKYDAEGGR